MCEGESNQYASHAHGHAMSPLYFPLLIGAILIPNTNAHRTQNVRREKIRAFSWHEALLRKQTGPISPNPLIISAEFCWIKAAECQAIHRSVVVQLVRILGSHPRDPGSSPGNGIFWFLCLCNIKPTAQIFVYIIFLSILQIMCVIISPHYGTKHCNHTVRVYVLIIQTFVLDDDNLIQRAF